MKLKLLRHPLLPYLLMATHTFPIRAKISSTTNLHQRYFKLFIIQKPLTNLIGQNGFTCKSSTSYLIVQPSGLSNFNIIVKHLNDTDAKFRTFKPRRFRSVRFIIRNLHFFTAETDIVFALFKLEYSVVQVQNISDANNVDITKILSLLNTKLIITLMNVPKIGIVRPNVLFAPEITPPTSGAALLSKELKKNPRFLNASPTKVPAPNPHSRPKSYAEATRTQDFSTDNFSILLSNFITNLNSLISPLITLLSSVLHTLIPKASLSK
ncbi:hypothetical protein QTP88_002673 [Uroleucon formosanum]